MKTSKKIKTGMSLVSKINLLITIVILFSVGVVGFEFLQKEKENDFQKSIKENERNVRLNRLEIEKTLLEVANDAGFLAKLPPVHGIIRARANGNIDPVDGTTEKSWRQRLSLLFKGLLEEKHQYFNIRFIGTADNGREIVRVDRMDGEIIITDQKDLQAKGHRRYFIETSKLSEGEVYFSPINLNREFGKIEFPHRPVLRVGVPVHSKKGLLFGILVLNLEIRPVLNLFIERDPHYFIVNADGDFLAHPDPGLTFGFDLGKRHTIQDIYPELKAHFQADTRQKEIAKILTHNGQDESIYLWKVKLGNSDQSPFIWLGRAQKVSELVAKVNLVDKKILLLVCGLIVVSLIVGIYFTRRMVSPLNEIALATANFTDYEIIPNLNIRSRDEIGSLANSIQSMMATIHERNESLRKNQTYVKTLLDSTWDPIITIDKGGIIELFNPAAEKEFGYQVSEVLGKNIKILMPEPYKSEHDGYLENYLRTGIAKIIGIDREVVGLRKDGSTFPIDLAINEMVLGEEKKFVGVCRNITARKKAEEILNKKMEITQKDNWLRIGISQIHQSMHGEQELDKISQNVIGCLANYLDAKVGALFLTQNGGLQLTGKYAYTHRDDLPVTYKIGEGLVGQAALEKKCLSISNVPENYVRIQSGLGVAPPKHILLTPLVFEESLVGVVELGFLEAVPENYIEFLNLSAESVAINLVTARSRAKMKDLLLETQAQAEELRLQQEEMTQAQFELEQANTNLIEQQNHLIQQKQEIEIKNSVIEEKAKQIELASKYKSEFLANMSHELRTPLNSMLILSKILAENKEGTLTPKQIEFAQTVHGSGTDLLNLINDILDLSKVESGNMEIHIQNVDINQWLQSYNNKFQPIAEEKGLYFKTELPEGGTPFFIQTDPARLDQIIKNLLSNSFKFTSAGGVTLKAYLLSAGEKKRFKSKGGPYIIAISVSDTGKGISREKQEQIFDAFQQEDGSISRNFGGTGLGLSISRAMVKLLGGEILLESEPEKGSTFTIYLPKGKPQSSDLNLQEKSYASVSVKPKDKLFQMPEAQKRILIIEDDAQFAQVLKHLGEQKGYECVIARDGEAGLAMVKSFKPGGIFLDIGMPRLNGLQVLKTLKGNSRTRDIPIIVISVQGKGNEVRELGALDYIEKPITEEQLVESLEQLEQYIVAIQKNILVVEDTVGVQKAITDVFRLENVNLVFAESGEEAEAKVNNQTFDCMILDLGLPDQTGFDLLEKLKNDDGFKNLPVIIYTAKDLSREEANQLRKYSNAIIIKTVGSIDRLLEETRQCFYDSKKGIAGSGEKFESTENIEVVSNLEGKKILLVDDDIRNIYALTQVMETKKLRVITGKNGEEALEKLQSHSDIQMVLMDIMMPVMDGITTIKEIRKNPRYKNLTIIALTAKAMKGDREKCLNAGASDYLTKPVDTGLLFSTIQSWLFEKNSEFL